MGQSFLARALAGFRGMFYHVVIYFLFDDTLEAMRIIDNIRVTPVSVLYPVNYANVFALTKIIFTACKMEQFTFVGSYSITCHLYKFLLGLLSLIRFSS